MALARTSLSATQKEAIELCLESFLSFSENPTEFISEVSNIMHALTAKEMDPENYFFHLNKSFHDPASKLHGLEKFGGEIYVGDIQKYIIDLASQRIQEAAEKFKAQGVNLLFLSWDPSRFDHIIQANLSKIYTPQKSRTESEDPSHFMDTTNRVFEVDIKQAQDERFQNHFMLYIKLKRYPNEEEKNTRYHLAPPLEDDDDSAQYMQDICIKAKKLTEEHASRLNFKKLITEYSISPDDQKNMTFGTKKVLTYEFYLQRLQKKEISLNELCNLNKEQANTLTHEQTMTLFEKKILNLSSAKQLTVPEKTVILNSFYSNSLINGTFVLNQFIDITFDQSKILIHPAVVNLIKLKIITLDDAKKISIDALDVICHESYQALIIKKGKAHFYPLQNLNENEKTNLLEPAIINLVFEGLLPIEYAKRLPSRALQKLTVKNINDLIRARKLTVADALLICKEAVDNIESNQNIYWLIAEGIMAPNDAANILSYDAPSCSIECSSLSNSKKQLLKEIMPHFLAFAKDGLLYEHDLCRLYNHLKTHTSEQNNSHSFLIEEIMHLATTNMHNRIHDVLNKRPITLHDYGWDNIKKIQLGCELLGINFNTIRDHSIENELLNIEKDILAFHKGNPFPIPSIYTNIITIINEAKKSSDPEAWYVTLNRIANIAEVETKEKINRLASPSNNSNQAENKIEMRSPKRKLSADEKQEDSPSKKAAITRVTFSENTPLFFKPATNNQEESTDYLEENETEYHFFHPTNDTEMQIAHQLETFEKIRFLAQTLRKDDSLEKINELVRKTRAPQYAAARFKC